jgi:hypothetical protein
MSHRQQMYHTTLRRLQACQSHEWVTRIRNVALLVTGVVCGGELLSAPIGRSPLGTRS